MSDAYEGTVMEFISIPGLPTRWYYLKPHEVRNKLWKQHKRIKRIVAGRRSGKTEIAKRYLVLNLPVKKQWDDPRYFYGGPTYDQAKRIAWEDLKKLIPKNWQLDVSESELCIKTTFGSEVWVVGFDKPQRFEGPAWDGGILDEACDQKPGTYTRTIYPALMDRNGWCWEQGVPKRDGPSTQEFKKRCEEAQAGKDDEAEYYHWTSEGILDDSIIEHARKVLDRKTYREQLLATWETISGSCYEAFRREYNVRPCSYRPHLPIVVASDFNRSPMAWVLCHTIDGRIIEVFDELWDVDMITERMLTKLYTKYGNHSSGFMFYGDATARGKSTTTDLSDYNVIEADKRFQKLGRTVHYPASNPTQKTRVKSVNAKLQAADGSVSIFVDPRCEHLIDSLESTTWNPGTFDIYKTNNEHDITHPSDALGYFVYYEWPIWNFEEVEEEGTTQQLNVSVGI